MSHRPLILGHRGASASAPENTLAAFSRAISDGADGIEFDVRLSRDGAPVVIHDSSLKRTGLTDRRVSELTASQLQKVDVGSWFTQAGSPSPFGSETLPLLTDVFELFRKNNGWLYVEMKCGAREAAALAAAVARLTKESQIADRVVVESFDHSAIKKVKELESTIRTAALFEPKLSQPLSLIRRLRVVDQAIAAGADEIALHHSLAGARVVDNSRQKGLEVVVWTVDDPTWINRAQASGIKALIANNPALMLQHRDAS